MTTYQQRWIEILDRHYHLANEVAADDFWLELARFLDFLVNEEPFRPYTARLQREFADWLREYQTILNEEVDTAIQIRRELTGLYPELDDSDTPQPAITDNLIEVDFSDPYFQSLAIFDVLVARVQVERVTLWPRSGNFSEQDPTETANLIRLLQQKLLSLPKEQISEALFLRLQHLSETHSHLRVEFISDCRVWPPAASVFLLEVRQAINPAPELFASVSDWLSARANDAIQNMTQTPPNMEFCRVLLRRVYEQIRTDFGTHLAHYELIQRYKTRCMVYDRKRITALATSSEGHREDALTRDLALYLFDNGVLTHYRMMQGVHEYDLIAPSIVVEAKEYHGNDRRQYLVRGISQLHSYANGLETDRANIRELYYVIFRLGGPLYDWPDRIEMNQWTIYPVAIDLGPSRESGSKQRRVQSITLEEIYGAIPDVIVEEAE